MSTRLSQDKTLWSRPNRFIPLCVILTATVGCTVINETLLEQYPVTPVVKQTVVIEAEDFATQHLDNKRRWLIMSAETAEHNLPDADLPHYQTASGGQYIEILPDTRVNHFDPLVRGENFSAFAGQVAVLTYPVYFKSAGKYIVWSRAFSTGSEDNGVHIGLNGQWPESSQRVQFCKGKHQWTWSSAQRRKDNHCGVPNTITLDIPSKGVHTVMVSMREDGFELDKLILTQDETYQPNGIDLSAAHPVKPALQEKTEFLGIKEHKRILRADKDFEIKHNKTGFDATFVVGKKDRGSSQLILVAVDNLAHVNYKLGVNNKDIGQFQTQKSSDQSQAKEVYFRSNKVELAKGDVITLSVSNIPSSVETNSAKTKVKPEHIINNLWRALVITRSK